jgi:IS5 family transposase
MEPHHADADAAATIETGIKMGAIRPAQLKTINVDTTVQTKAGAPSDRSSSLGWKAIRFPTDARLYNRCQERLVKVARQQGLVIKQSYRHVGKRLLLDASRYAHARQMKRARAAMRKLRTQLGRVMREIERKVTEPTEKLAKLLETARRIHAQQRHDKNKVYSVHEPVVECIVMGKAGKQYEFGNKVSAAVTSRGGWMVGARRLNPASGI